MANEVAAHELGRWACALGGAVLVHGALLLSSAAEQIAPDEADLPALVWLEASADRDATPEIAGLALHAHPSSPSPRVANKPRVRSRSLHSSHSSKPRAKPAKPSSNPSSESAAPSAALPSAAMSSEGIAAMSSDGEEQARLPLGAEPAEAATEYASAGGPAAWGTGGPLAAGAAGGGGSGGGAAPSNKPSFPPGLIAFGDPCRGFYPSAAHVDHGEVRVVVRVGSDGSTRGSDVVAEIPARQGFGPAARACVSRLRFRPARDAGGDAIAGQAVLALSFDRS